MQLAFKLSTFSTTVLPYVVVKSTKENGFIVMTFEQSKCILKYYVKTEVWLSYGDVEERL
jgi:hypothetical protein